MLDNARINPAPDGTFEIDNGLCSKICSNANDIGAELEEMLWPLIEPALKERKPITIKIEYGTYQI